MTITNQINFNYNIPFNTPAQSHNHLNNLKFRNSESFIIMYMNARSIRNKSVELNYILNTLTNDIQIIALSEHWLKESELKFFNFFNYDTVFACRPKKECGGAGFLISRSLNYKIIKIYSDDENSFVTVCVKNKGKSIIATVVYRPPGTNAENVSTFLNLMDKHFGNSDIANKSAIVVGDFNFNLLETNRINSDYINMMQSNNLNICNNTIITWIMCFLVTLIYHCIFNT